VLVETVALGQLPVGRLDACVYFSVDTPVLAAICRIFAKCA
jgi:hypothetical protein